MAARVEKGQGDPPSRDQVKVGFEQKGLHPRDWGNGPGERYDWHSHGYHKVLHCVAGSIVFHTRDGDVALEAGDLMEVDPGTEHAATVGPRGVECIEASR